MVLLYKQRGYIDCCRSHRSCARHYLFKKRILEYRRGVSSALYRRRCDSPSCVPPSFIFYVARPQQYNLLLWRLNHLSLKCWCVLTTSRDHIVVYFINVIVVQPLLARVYLFFTSALQEIHASYLWYQTRFDVLPLSATIHLFSASHKGYTHR